MDLKTAEEKAAERKRLKRKERKLEEALAVAIAERERLDDDLSDARPDRNREKRRKAAGREYDQDLLRELNEQIRDLRADLELVQQKIRDRRSWLEGVRERVADLTRQIRILRRPRIIALDLDFRAMTRQPSGISKVIGHYTAGPRDRNTADAIRLCRIYHQAHLAKGWSGEGYHLCFTRSGDILLLRPTSFVGAHTLGANTGSIGIMMHGTTGDTASRAQKRALRWWAKHGASARMLTGRIAVTPKNLPWYGHNDFNATSCPGAFKGTYISRGRK